MNAHMIAPRCLIAAIGTGDSFQDVFVGRENGFVDCFVDYFFDRFLGPAAGHADGFRIGPWPGAPCLGFGRSTGTCRDVLVTRWLPSALVWLLRVSRTRKNFSASM
jgi:hypothetical protein